MVGEVLVMVVMVVGSPMLVDSSTATGTATAVPATTAGRCLAWKLPATTAAVSAAA